MAAVQVAVAFAGAVQTVVQLPQWFGSVFVLAHALLHRM
jgi:hypothetical protein